MLLPPVVRVFFAIDLQPAMKEILGGFIADLKRSSKSHSIRWGRPENLHITLQFLAKVQSEHIPTLISEVRNRVVGVVQPDQLVLGNLKLFPNVFRPRVIVMDVVPQGTMAKLSYLIGQGILGANYEIEDRPYRAHLTLGRIKQPQEVNLDFLAKVNMPVIEAVPIEEVVLFRSEPQDQGTRYTAMERIRL